MRISDWSSDVCSSDLLVQAIGVGLTFDRERRGRTRDDEVAGFGDAFTRLMRYRQTSALDEPQHRDVGSVFTDMRPVAPEEQAALGAQENERTRTNRLAIGEYGHHRDSNTRKHPGRERV